MDAKCSSETSVDFQRNARRYVPENNTFHTDFPWIWVSPQKVDTGANIYNLSPWHINMITSGLWTGLSPSQFPQSPKRRFKQNKTADMSKRPTAVTSSGEEQNYVHPQKNKTMFILKTTKLCSSSKQQNYVHLQKNKTTFILKRTKLC
jgi:hypothetical protein